MKKMTILLDLDDTITIFMETCIKKYNEIYGTNHSIEEITQWEIDGIFEHDLWSIFDKSFVLQHMPLKKGAKETIIKWHEKGHKIVIVTGTKNMNNFQDKLIWLDNVGLTDYIYEIIPTRHKELIKGDVLIDDNPKYLNEWKENNTNGLSLLMTAQHNKRPNPSHYGHIRVNNWEEIRDWITVYELL